MGQFEDEDRACFYGQRGRGREARGEKQRAESIQFVLISKQIACHKFNCSKEQRLKKPATAAPWLTNRERRKRREEEEGQKEEETMANQELSVVFCRNRTINFMVKPKAKRNDNSNNGNNDDNSNDNSSNDNNIAL